MFIHTNNNVFIFLNEGKIRKYKNIQHLFDAPMFSVYVTNTVKNDSLLNKLINVDDIKKKCEAARNEIHRIGFPSMHANIIIDNISANYRNNLQSSAGLAVPYKQHMVIDVKHINVNVIVHEWAHLWMFNKPKNFKKSVNDVYDSLMAASINKIKSITYDDVIKYKHVDKSSNLDPKHANLYKFLLRPTTISTEMLEYWENYFYNIIQTNNKSVGRYRLLNKAFSKKLMSALPRGFRFENTLKTNIILTAANNTHITAPVGTLVYVEKYDKLIIGVNQNNRRYEKVIEFADVDKILGVDTYDKIGMILKYNPIGFEKKSKKQLESEILNFLIEDAIQTFESTVRKFIYNKFSLDREKEVVKIWIKQYVFPIYIKIIRNTDTFDKIKNTEKDKIYNVLWVNNSLKPSNTSFLDMITIIYNKNQLIKHITNQNLTGHDLTDIRYIIRELVDWVNEYGTSNNNELWSTAIELFFKLPLKYRKIIVNLMI